MNTVFGKGQDESANANVFGNDRIQTASTEGSMAPAGTQTGQTAQAPKPATEQGTNSRARLFQANAGKVGSPVDLNKTQGAIKNADRALQNEANNFVQDATKPYWSDKNIDPGTDPNIGLSWNTKAEIDDFAGVKRYDARDKPDLGAEPLPPPPNGENPNPSKSMDWQTLFKSGPGPIDPFTSHVNTVNTDADMIGTDAGLQNLFRNQGGAEYTAGGAALDTALLRKNAKFNELRDQTLAQNRMLQEKAGTIGATTDQAAKAAVDKAHGSWTGDVRDRLEGAIDFHKGEAGKLEQAFDLDLSEAALQDQNQVPLSASQAEMAQLAKSNPELVPYLQSSGNLVSASDFYRPSGVTAKSTKYDDFIDDERAASWNKVLGILGLGGETVTAGKYAGKNYKDLAKGSFDSSGFADAVLNQATGMKSSMDKAAAEKAAAKAAAEAAKAAKAAAAEEAAREEQAKRENAAINAANKAAAGAVSKSPGEIAGGVILDTIEDATGMGVENTPVGDVLDTAEGIEESVRDKFPKVKKTINW